MRRGVSFAVRSGVVVAIVGEGGTGKRTLMHPLSALDRPDSGTVHVDGYAIFLKDDDALAAFRNRSVGFIFQFHHLLPEFTALENVAMPGLIQGLGLEAARPRVLELLANSASKPAPTIDPANSRAASSNAWRWPGR